MKFITEYDLRAQFNEQPFADYQMEENTRLTPGARQFYRIGGLIFLRMGQRCGSARQLEIQRNRKGNRI